MPVKKNLKKVAKVAVKTVAKSAGASKSDPKFDVYKKMLLGIKEKIAGDLRNLSDENTGSGNDRGGDVSGHAMHMADVATDMYDREFTLGLAANERELLHHVNDALERVSDGTYGVCTVCKKNIPAPRLKAIPHAQLCLKCQEKSELKRSN